MNTPVPDSKANNLLNLLRFNANNAQASQSSPLTAMQNVGTPRTPSHGEAPASSQSAISASDLVASFHRKPSSSTPAQVHVVSQPAREDGITSPTGNAQAQDFLLNLLNRPKQTSAEPIQAPQPQVPAFVENLTRDMAMASIEVETPHSTTAERDATPARMFGTRESRESTPFEAPPVAAVKSGIFTYVNPFEQLSASSPRRTPKPEGSKAESSKHARDVSDKVNGKADPEPASKTRKMNASPAPPVKEERSQPAAATAAAADPHVQSVSEELADVAEKVDKQVEKALAQADIAQAAPAAKKTTVDDIKAEEVADSWESADAEESPAKSAGGDVEVYNFPMKPFVSIQIKKAKPSTNLRADSLMDIARLKKEFDQIDRTLATASTSHIVYAMAKNAGFRVIRQDSGKDRQVFKASNERIFNIQMCSNSSSLKDTEAVLATGINGSVYWTTLNKNAADDFDDENLESQGFILPPVPVHDDNTSGSPVKTRAKTSSRHLEMFGISRGKSIYIISSLVARQPSYTDKKTRVVDNEKFLQDHCLKIVTGKAGKDFAFSEDDSLIVSLDKSGRIKFWDIREMADLARDANAGKRPAIELKNPLLTLTTTSSAEKATPSSVMFVDKERPCVKGVALRYLIVGLKQNHILQLWDLGLNKPVQELHFPHDKDSDAICSISYHPKSGIIALGHPTRNSIFFIHLSAPRYHIPNMDQARYTTMLATQDAHLPRPESTAIMSGLREYSFASKGQLRSIDMLKTPAASEGAEDVLFELYAMHSKGVTCIGIKREDLGWGPDGKVLNPVDAESTGAISVSSLHVAAAATASSEASGAEAANKVRPATKEETTLPVRQKVEPAKSPLPSTRPAEPKESKAEPAAVNGAAKVERKKPEEVATPAKAVHPEIITPASYAMAAQRAKSPYAEKTPAAIPETSAAKANGMTPPDVEAVIKSVATGLNAAFSGELNALYKRFDDDRRVQDAAASAKQDAVLRLVSSTLSDNVEKSLNRIVSSTIQDSIVPALSETVTTMLDRRLNEALSQHLGKSLPAEVRASLPAALTKAMQDKEVQKAISDQTVSKLSAQVDQTINNALRTTVQSQATATQKSVADLERRLADQSRQAELQRQKDSAKIEQLTNLVRGMSEVVQTMAAGQTAFQEQILHLQRQVNTASHSHEESTRSSASVRSTPAQPPADPEIEAVTALMTQGKYEEATIQVSIAYSLYI